jgi:hypothetical protein
MTCPLDRTTAISEVQTATERGVRSEETAIGHRRGGRAAPTKGEIHGDDR